MKIPPYFPHPTGFRYERGVKRAMKDFGGALAYGAIMYMIEVLASQPSLRYPISDIDILSDEIGVSVPILLTIIEKYEIFEVIENHFFSIRLEKSLQPYFEKIEQREAAGKISAQKRKIKIEKQIKELEIKLSQSNSIKRNDSGVTLSQSDSIQQIEENKENRKEEIEKTLSSRESFDFKKFKEYASSFFVNFSLSEKLGYSSDHKGFQIRNGYIYSLHTESLVDSNEAFRIWEYLFSVKSKVFKLIDDVTVT